MSRSCAALLIILLLAPSTVSAHAYLVKSVPAQRAVLFRAPAKIQLWFNERLEPALLFIHRERCWKVKLSISAKPR